MPILEETDESELGKVTETPRITAPEYKGVTVDSRYIPTAILNTHVEGAAWSVNYYSQLLDKDSALSGHQVNRNAVYQQYRLIEGLELRVSNPLTATQDNTGKSMIVNGTANVLPFLIPNEGDMFLADIGDGKEGLFKVTTSDRKSYFKEAIHVIEYQMIDYSTDERREDLNSKVIQNLVFVKDFLKYGQNPILELEEFVTAKNLEFKYYSICEKYFSSFTSNEFKTMIMPGQDKPVYDHFLTKSINKMFSTFDSSDIRSIRILNCDDDDILRTTSLWDVLIKRDRSILKYSFRRFGMVSTRTFTTDPMLEGIRYSGIKKIIYPKDPQLNVDYQISYNQKLVEDLEVTEKPSQIRNLSDLLTDTEFQGLTLPDVPVINEVLDDDYYVLSKAFYENLDTGKSLLDLCVDRYIDRKPQDIDSLVVLCNKCHAWNAMEQFYFYPILLLLLKSAILFIK